MIILLKIFLATWFFTEFDPLQDFINNTFEKIKSNKIIDSIHILLGCHKCLSFWITLFITFNIWYALGVSFIAAIIQKIK